MCVKVCTTILPSSHECLSDGVNVVVVLNVLVACFGNGCFVCLCECFGLAHKRFTCLLSFNELLPSPATVAELNKQVMFWLCGTVGFQSKTCCFVLHLPCNGSIWRLGAGAAGGTLRSQPQPSLLYTNSFQRCLPSGWDLRVPPPVPSPPAASGNLELVYLGTWISGDSEIWTSGTLLIWGPENPEI